MWGYGRWVIPSCYGYSFLSCRFASWEGALMAGRISKTNMGTDKTLTLLTCLASKKKEREKRKKENIKRKKQKLGGGKDDSNHSMTWNKLKIIANQPTNETTSPLRIIKALLDYKLQ